MITTASRPQNLGDACIAEALRVIESQGIEHLSLREVARRLRVSHQAPYKHFPSRDHLVVEVIRRCFNNLTAALRGRAIAVDPLSDLHAVGRAYLQFARSHPVEYRLMFSTPWPDAQAHADLIRDARYAFEVLRESLAHLYQSEAPGQLAHVPESLDQDAIFIWSSMHGLASIMESDCMAHLQLDPEVRLGVPDHVMLMIDKAILSRKSPPSRDPGDHQSAVGAGAVGKLPE